VSATRTSPTRAQRSSRTTARGCGYRTQAGPDPGGQALRRAMRLRAGPTTHVRFEAIMEPRGEWTAVDRRQGAPDAADSQPPITPRPISAATVWSRSSAERLLAPRSPRSSSDTASPPKRASSLASRCAGSSARTVGRHFAAATYGRTSRTPSASACCGSRKALVASSCSCAPASVEKSIASV